MVFHPAHGHWHLENFARYELKPIDGNGNVGTAVAASTKVSFCIIDVHHPFPTLPGSPGAKYYTQCDRNSTLGISIGWSDEYHSTLADQYIVITNVPDGIYCLVSTADPLGNRHATPPRGFAELSRTNNAAGVKITITGPVVEPRHPTQVCGS